MPLTEMCLCYLVVRGPDGTISDVLLGRKKTGFGTGYIVGLGGRLEPGETARAATVREVMEESSVAVAESDLSEHATVVFRFPARPDWDCRLTVFVSDRWQREPQESDEIAPQWYSADALPLDLMWDDARYWFHRVLNGEQFDGDIVFNDDCRTVRQATLTPRHPTKG
ncbi:NUDIX domain-containing protein [Kribbella sp. NPDC005582]|uniref:8-oxo-dGTP diphosphatase n=1 Tax=Kribbella sp. NPDC005582 TaxID=3156893 RepID=UPI0033B8E2FA